MRERGPAASDGFSSRPAKSQRATPVGSPRTAKPEFSPGQPSGPCLLHQDKQTPDKAALHGIACQA